MDLEQARRQAWQQQMDFLLGKTDKKPIQPYTTEESDALDKMLAEYIRGQGYKDDLETPEIAFLNRLMKIGPEETVSGRMTIPEQKPDEYDSFISGMKRRFNTFIGR